MNNPSLPTQQPTETVTDKPAEQPTTSSILSSMGVISYIIAGILLVIIPAIGAAKLSHDRFGSIGWAIVAFIFAPFYYTYYAFFVSTKVIQQPIVGGRRRR